MHAHARARARTHTHTHMQGRAPVLQLDLQGSRVLRQAVPPALILCYLPGTMEHILAATSRQKVSRGASCARVTALLHAASMLRMHTHKGCLYEEVQALTSWM